MTCKTALTWDDVSLVCSRFMSSPDHDDSLFLTIFLTAFFSLLWLGEVTAPDKLLAQDLEKLSLQLSLSLLVTGYSFWLPRIKANASFEGNHVVIMSHDG